MPRTDLTANFLAAIQTNGRAPRQLAVFHFSSVGDIHLSDQSLGASDGLANEYSPLVIDWGTLQDMAGGDPTNTTAGEIRQLTLTLWNGGDSPFSDYFLEEDPENVKVDLYQWVYGISESDKALIDTFVIQDPISFDEASQLLKLDLVSLSMRYDNPLGDVLSTDDWPNAKTSDIGKGIDLIFGSPGEVGSLEAKTAPSATLDGSILSNTLTINVKENLDDLNFAASGDLQIGEEKIRYSSRTSSAFTVSQRGWTSTAAEHLDGDEVIQFITDHTFVVGKGPIQAINNVKVKGIAAPSSIYTVYPALDPARIVFSEKPYSTGYATGSTFLEMQFDSVNPGNTAIQPHLAFDPDGESTAALTSPSNRKLDIKQATVNPDRGEIVKAYLAVEHWEDGVFLNDYVEVSVEGIGVVGRLSRPNPNDVIDVVGEVDIDHTHNHSISGEHFHVFTDPTLQLNDPSHGHGLTGVSSDTDYYPTDPTGVALSVPFGSYGSAVPFRFLVSPLSWNSAVLNINLSRSFATIRVRIGYGVAGSGEPYVRQQLWTGEFTSSGVFNIGLGTAPVPNNSAWDAVVVEVSAYGSAYGATASVGAMKFTATRGSSVQPAQSGNSINTLVSGSNQNSSDKAINDVNPLATANVNVQITESQKATQTVVNLFDVTDAVNFDWNWFTDRDITVEYIGSNDNRNVYILHAFFDVEYRKKEIVFSGDITCEPDGIIDDSLGTITGSPNSLITRPDFIRKYLLNVVAGLPLSYIDNNSFNSAGTQYANKGYRFDTVLDANLTVRDVEKKGAFQTRSRWFWNAGQAKIKLRKKLSELVADKYLTSSDLKLRSMSVERQRTSDIINTINLLYHRDWTVSNGLNAYMESTSSSDPLSISQHGIYEDRSLWQFDMVKQDGMADDLLDFYLTNRSNPSSFYTFETYLHLFDLEKDDTIAVTSNFNQLRKALMIVRAVDRVFGNGNTNKINLLRITAESLRYILLSINLDDSVQISDILTATIGKDVDINDLIHVLEEIIVDFGLNLTETLTILDTLSAVISFVETIPETITASDAITAIMNVNITDSVIVQENLTVYGASGFGFGGFGNVGFGGRIILAETIPQTATISDILSILISPVLTDSATVSDSLVIGNGFGGSLSSGFGNSPFGG